MFLRKTFIDMRGMKTHSLILKTFDDMLMNGPESFGRKRRSAKSILVGHHDQSIIKFPGDPSHVFENLGIEFKFLPCIDLITGGDFFDQTTIAVDEENSLHTTG